MTWFMPGEWDYSQGTEQPAQSNNQNTNTGSWSRIFQGASNWMPWLLLAGS